MPQNQPQPSSNLNEIQEWISLMKEYDPRLHSLAAKQLNGRGLLPDDAVNRTYYAYSRKPSRDVRSRFGLLGTILVRLCWKDNNRKHPDQGNLPDDYDVPIDAPWTRPEADMEYADLSRRISDKINKLTQLQHDVIILKYFQNLDHNEIAETLGISVPAVGRHHRAALDRLREMLKEGDL